MLCWWVLVFFFGGGGEVVRVVAKTENRDPLMSRFNISIIVCVFGFLLLLLLFFNKTLHICIQGSVLMYVFYTLSM